MSAARRHAVSPAVMLVESEQRAARRRRYVSVQPAEDDVPECLRKFVRKKTGGIGEHIRMQVQWPTGDGSKPATLLVTNVGVDDDDPERARFEELVSSLGAYVDYCEGGLLPTAQVVAAGASGPAPQGPIAARCPRYKVIKGMVTCALTLRTRMHMQSVIARFGWRGFGAYCLNAGECHVVEYVPDKLSRCVHMWVEQYILDAATAGPVRDAWRWRLAHLPAHWDVVYTMPGVARQLVLDALGRSAGGALSHLPPPPCGSPPAHWRRLEHVKHADLTRWLAALPTPLRHCASDELGGMLDDGRAAVQSDGLSLAAELIIRGNECKALKASAAHSFAIAKAVTAIRSSGDAEKVVAAVVLEREVHAERCAARARAEEINAARTRMRGVDAHLSALRRTCAAGAQPLVVPSLTEAQMRQLLQCTFCLDYAELGDERAERIKAILFVYNLHGHVGRLVGNYQRSGKFRGFGHFLRVYEAEKSAALQLPEEVRSRIKGSVNGRLLGTGGRGYKGIRKDITPERGWYKRKFIRHRQRGIDIAVKKTKPALAALA